MNQRCQNRACNLYGAITCLIVMLLVSLYNSVLASCRLQYVNDVQWQGCICQIFTGGLSNWYCGIAC